MIWFVYNIFVKIILQWNTLNILFSSVIIITFYNSKRFASSAVGIIINNMWSFHHNFHMIFSDIQLVIHIFLCKAKSLVVHPSRLTEIRRRVIHRRPCNPCYRVSPICVAFPSSWWTSTSDTYSHVRRYHKSFISGSNFTRGMTRWVLFQFLER